MDFIEASKPISVVTNSSIGILVIHGITSTPGSMGYICEQFIKAGFNVECPLLPGHGTKWEDMNGITWQQWLQTTSEHLHNLTARCSKVFVLGLSLGGALALALAEQNKKITGIILVNHLCLLKGILPKLAFVAKYFLKSIPAVANDIKDKSQTEPAYNRVSSFGGYQAVLLANKVKKALPSITTPTLIFKSNEDHVIPLSSATYTFKHLASLNKELVWLTNSYHVATLDFDKDVIVYKAILFINSLSN